MPRQFRLAVLSAALLCAAIAFSVSFLNYRTNQTEAHADGTEVRTFDGKPIVQLGFSVADFVCVLEEDGRRPDSCDVIAAGSVTGLYPHEATGVATTVILGIFVPYLFAVTAGFLVLRTLNFGRARIGIAVAGLLAGLYFLVPTTFEIYKRANFRRDMDIEAPDVISLYDLRVLGGATLLAAAFWLVSQRIRPR